jgi:hypothetical protein
MTDQDANQALKNIENHIFNLSQVLGDMLSDMEEYRVRSIVQAMLEAAIANHQQEQA